MSAGPSDGTKTWDLASSAVRPPHTAPVARRDRESPLRAIDSRGSLRPLQPVPTPLTFDTAATFGQPAAAPGSSAAGCLASLQFGGSAAREYLNNRALPQLNDAVAYSRLWYAERAVPAAAKAMEYSRDVALPAAKEWVNNTALPAARDAVAYSQTVVVPAVQQGYAYAVEVALPQAQALISGSALPPRPVQVSSGGDTTAVETEREVVPPQHVPTAAGSDEQLPAAREASPEPAPASPMYTTLATTVAATVAAETEQRSPLLEAATPTASTFATVPLTPRDPPEGPPQTAAVVG